MINNIHTIGTLHFELETYDKKYTQEIQKNLSRYGRKEIPDIIEKSLNQLEIDNSTVIIDKLEIDLGEISTDEFHTNFLLFFSKQFYEKISEFHFKDSVVRSKEIKVLDEEKSDIEILKYFLLSGTIPWYAENKSNDLQTIFGNAVNTKSGEFVSFIKDHLKSDNFAERLVYQFPEDPLIQLLESIFKIKLDKHLQFTRQLFSSVGESGQLKVKIPYPNQQMMIVIIELLLTAEGKTYADFKENYIKAFVEKYRIEPKIILKLISKRDIGLKKKPLIKKPLIKTSKVISEKVRTRSKDDLVLSTEKSEKPTEEEPVSYYISNAGLSLLHPFLPELFRKLKLVHKNEFVDEVSVHKAIHLSQYAVFGNKVRPEYLLVLNKLICGYPLDSPIPIKVNLSRREKAETTRMVNAAIKHWSALKNTSAKGFRASFLNREGLLKQTENGWKLFVERKAHDVLLDRIPWSYHIVKLPWMDKIIEIEW